MNSDNILIPGDAAGVTLVDFQKAGRGHIYEDLVALETSVRINYPPDAGFGEILEIERLIARGQWPPALGPYAQSIRRIRDAASRRFGPPDDDTYHFAVAAIGVRLMQAVDVSDVARARITASTLWATQMLAGERPR
jgi:hypothetical protein